MARAIWKYRVPYGIASSPARLNLPIGARVLAVQMQDGMPCVWALVDPAASLVPRYLNVYGTGWTLPDPDELGTYHGTFQDGPYVFHVFEPPSQWSPHRD